MRVTIAAGFEGEEEGRLGCYFFSGDPDADLEIVNYIRVLGDLMRISRVNYINPRTVLP